MSILANLTSPTKTRITNDLEAERWMTERIRAGRKGFFVEIVDVTPVLATNMISRNTSANRKIRERVVEEYARAMSEGRWLLTSQGISFSKDGLLDNGQHRLEAIIMSGITVPMTVAFGQTEEAFAVLDSGSRRRASDALRAVGFANEHIVAGIIARVINISNGKAGRSIRPTHDEIVDAASNDKFISDAARTGHRLGRGLRTTDVGIGLGAYYILAADRRPEEFFNRISNGVISGSRDPVKFLRESAMLGEFKGDAGIYQAAAQMINAWNLTQAGKSGRPTWDPNDDFPTVKV